MIVFFEEEISLNFWAMRSCLALQSNIPFPTVPFCGKKSNAYQKFKGKFLTENHRWAPVFDPRYHEVREHLVNIYTNAVRDWKLNGLKLDFINEFKSYPETNFNQNSHRDYQSINKAVERLLSDMVASVKTINPDIFIAFRQK